MFLINRLVRRSSEQWLNHNPYKVWLALDVCETAPQSNTGLRCQREESDFYNTVLSHSTKTPVEFSARRHSAGAEGGESARRVHGTAGGDGH